jgi:hypothetical protein
MILTSASCLPKDWHPVKPMAREAIRMQQRNIRFVAFVDWSRLQMLACIIVWFPQLLFSGYGDSSVWLSPTEISGQDVSFPGCGTHSKDVQTQLFPIRRPSVHPFTVRRIKEALDHGVVGSDQPGIFVPYTMKAPVAYS